MQIENFAIRFADDRGKNKKDKSCVTDLSKEFKNKSNSELYARVRKEIDLLEESSFGLKEGRTFKNGLKAAIGLTGEYGLIGYAIRQAQAIIRLDRQPSSWSHSFIFYDEVPADEKLITGNNKKSPLIWESNYDNTVPLPLINTINGAAPRYLRDYDKNHFDASESHCVPNVAVIVFALNDEEVSKIMERASEPNIDQLRYNFNSLIGTWINYIFHKEIEENPLGAGNALYSSAYCQLAYDAIGIDLSAGLHSRNTSPESIWQSIRVFQNEFTSLGHPMKAYYCIRDPYCELIPFKEKESFTFSLKKANEMIKKK